MRYLGEGRATPRSERAASTLEAVSAEHLELDESLPRPLLVCMRQYMGAHETLFYLGGKTASRRISTVFHQFVKKSRFWRSTLGRTCARDFGEREHGRPVFLGLRKLLFSGKPHLGRWRPPLRREAVSTLAPGALELAHQGPQVPLAEGELRAGGEEGLLYM